ncbi:hypothetical protein mRhiFer1_008101 [Rhinolophus ferrumequinum]|uniref:Uncharacterized protein n=1 Tax=Rhinolophus ferrumequinum TaxID=59479 RepID=A0A7J7W7B8_RHIFE|nr:hypothetical protein mRhiFer1_008101 [Rhinolophus ferrumequinum]
MFYSFVNTLDCNVQPNLLFSLCLPGLLYISCHITGWLPCLAILKIICSCYTSSTKGFSKWKKPVGAMIYLPFYVNNRLGNLSSSIYLLLFYVNSYLYLWMVILFHWPFLPTSHTLDVLLFCSLSSYTDSQHQGSGCGIVLLVSFGCFVD